MQLFKFPPNAPPPELPVKVQLFKVPLSDPPAGNSVSVLVLAKIKQFFSVQLFTPPPMAAELLTIRQLFKVEPFAPPPSSAVLAIIMQLLSVPPCAPPPPLPPPITDDNIIGHNRTIGGRRIRRRLKIEEDTQEHKAQRWRHWSA